MLRHLELTPRLRALADLVPQGSRIADIGTDHAYLPVWLLLNDRIPGAIAADINKGPIARAQKTAAEYGCTQNISFLLCDGLSQVDRDSVDSIVIAGMGGETIASILQAAPWVCNRAYTLLLQPMSAQEELRGWLWRNGFSIEREELVPEEEKLYNILVVRFGGARELAPAEEWAGVQTRELVQPHREEYLSRLIHKLDRAISGLERGRGDQAEQRLRQLKHLRESLVQMKEEWCMWQA